MASVEDYKEGYLLDWVTQELIRTDPHDTRSVLPYCEDTVKEIVRRIVGIIAKDLEYRR